jgi:hypothetical protein
MKTIWRNGILYFLAGMSRLAGKSHKPSHPAQDVTLPEQGKGGAGHGHAKITLKDANAKTKSMKTHEGDAFPPGGRKPA